MDSERHSVSSRDTALQDDQIQPERRGHISCLPAEVLAEAFSYLLPESLAIDDVTGALEVESDKCLHDRRQHDDLIHITHVCRSWRHMCLSTASFWSLLWVTDEDCFASRTKEFIERSGNTPLEIAVRDERSRIQRFGMYMREYEDPFTGPLLQPLSNFFDQFPHIFHRLKTLRICSRLPPGQDFTACFDKAAPLLESFAIYNDDHTTTPFRLPSPLFNGCTPSLKKLSLDYAEVPWTSSVFKNLTLLSVCKDMDTPESNKAGLDVLLKIIESCPGLVSLELYFAGPVWPTGRIATDAGPVASVSPTLVASSLRNISLKGMTEMELVHAFLSCLQTTRLRTLEVGHNGLSFRSIDEFLPQTLSFDSRVDLCNCIKMDVDPNCEWVFMDQFLVGDLEYRMLEDPQYFSLRWLRGTKSTFERRIRVNNDDESHLGPEFEHGDPDEYRMLAMNFLRKMSPSPEHIRAIEIRGSDDVIMEFPFREVLEYLTNVYCIEIRYNLGYIRAGWFMDFLHTEAYINEHTLGVALPSVHMLIFDSVDFTPGHFKTLCFFLKHRKNRNVPISYLGINYCKGVGKKRLGMFEGLVTRVCVVDDDVFYKYGEEMDIPESRYNVDED